MIEMAYKHIFFDLDHTLWDYDTSAKQTLGELYQKYDLGAVGVIDEGTLWNAFYHVNESLWDKYNKGQISKFLLRNGRFKFIFDELGISSRLLTDDIIDNFNKDYLYECPQKPHLIPGAQEVLDECSGKYQLHIITNGFQEVQGTKMSSSGLDVYFTHVITSEEAKSKKPFPCIFEYALKKTDATKEESVMIGDNLQTDIKGARDFGMDHIYYNPRQEKHNDPVTHEVTRLESLLQIL
ncbi:MAG: YjjG family noncanonical pyrimidine nucleotidase [Cyclobacteriaceae bacterium]